MKKIERNLKLYGWLIFMLLAGPSLVRATTLSGTVNASYALGTYSITLAGQQGVYYTSNGSAFTQGFTGSLDNTASFSITVVGNDQIQPDGSQWKFTICNYGGGVCFTAQTTVTGSSQSVSTLLQGAAYPMPLTSTYTHFLGSPSGSCATTQQAEDDTTGLLYTCLSGSWHQSGGAVTWPLTSPSGATIASNSGDLEFTAGGTNQNITLTPSGAGVASIAAPNSTGYQETLQITRASEASSIDFLINGTSSYIGDSTSGSPLNIFVGSVSSPTSELKLSGNTISVANGNFAPRGETVAFSATPTFDARFFQVFEMTLTGNVTSFTLTPGQGWEEVEFIWKQDATGTRTVTAPASVHGFTTPGTTASTRSEQRCTYDGTDWTCGVANVNIP